VFSAFSGVGGFELGLPQDWEVIGQSEIDKNANRVLRYRFPDVKNYGDIEKIDYGEIPDFDVLIGGSPCQNLSYAGKREGLVGDKSRLFYSYITILKEKHPRYFVFENVAGLLSSNQGWDFAEVQDQFSKAGYDIWWQVLDAKDFGIPQHRERVFILGSLGGEGLRKVFLEPKYGQEDNGVSGQITKILVHSMMGRKGNPDHGGVGHLVSELPYSRTIDTGNGQAIELEGRIRHLTPLEAERLMGWPDEWTRWGIDEKGNKIELSNNARYHLIGNGVVPQVVSAVIKEVIE
jgi:DNA (cytosine-5)-methyltransferase 1